MATLTNITHTNWQLSLTQIGEVVQGVPDIEQQIKLVLFTIKGSDPLRPEFGCTLYDYIDKPINQVRAYIITSVLEALQLYVPLITVQSITPTVNATGILNVAINYKVTNTTNINGVNVTYGLTA